MPYKRKRSMSTSRPYKKPYRTRARRAMTSRFKSKRFARRIRTAVLNNTETKFQWVSGEDQQLYHNGGGPLGALNYQRITNMLRSGQGTGQAQNRIGDAVYGKLLSIKLWLSNKQDRPNVMYRIAVISVPPDQYNTATPSGLWRGESGNKIIDSFNTDKYKIIYHRLLQPTGNDYSIEQSALLREKSRYLKINIPLKMREIRYETDNSVLPTFQNNILGLVIIAYDATGTLMTDNIASFSYTTKFYFKDP